MDAVSQFTGAYYPFSRSNQEALKRHLLFFDKVEILIPPLVGLWSMPEYERRHISSEVIEARESFIDETTVLRDAGALVLLEPTGPGPGGGMFTQGIEDLWWTYELNNDAIHDDKQIGYRMDAWYWFLEASSRDGSIPFTDNDSYHDFLTRNYTPRLRGNAQGTNGLLPRLRSTASDLAVNILNSHLPDFECKSYEDILELRFLLDDAMQRFRSEMVRFAAKIRKSPWDDGYSEEMQRLVITDIEPAIAQLNRDAESIKYRKTSNWIKAALSLKPLPILGTAFIGVPVEYALAIAAGAITLDTLFESRRITKEMNANGLSLLLKC